LVSLISGYSFGFISYYILGFVSYYISSGSSKDSFNRSNNTFLASSSAIFVYNFPISFYYVFNSSSFDPIVYSRSAT